MKKIIIVFSLINCLVLSGYSQPFPITANIQHEGSSASGTFQIYRNSFTNNITLNNVRRPVEGFDPNGNYTIRPPMRKQGKCLTSYNCFFF